VLNVHQSYVFAEQQGLVNRVGSFFSGNPNSQQAVYILAAQKINNAAPVRCVQMRNATPPRCWTAC